MAGMGDNTRDDDTLQVPAGAGSGLRILPTPSTRRVLASAMVDAIEQRQEQKDQDETHNMIRARVNRHPLIACVRWLCCGCGNPHVVPTERTSAALEALVNSAKPPPNEARSAPAPEHERRRRRGRPLGSR